MIPTILPSKDEEIKGAIDVQETGAIARGNKKYYYIGVNRMTSQVQEEICDTEEMDRLEEIIDQRQKAAIKFSTAQN